LARRHAGDGMAISERATGVHDTCETRHAGHGTATRFYQPELDALRFFAFLSVLIHHGPKTAGIFGAAISAGGFGLSMFFLLSAYLITELLIREREQSGTVVWRLFFIRRALRIWPLYYAALATVTLLVKIWPQIDRLGNTGIAGLVFFVANWVPIFQLGVLLGPLWSISIEEQFYFIWPPIVKAGGARLALAVSICFTIVCFAWLAIFHGNGWWLWFATPVQFLFFAAGAMIAIAVRSDRMGWMKRIGVVTRVTFFMTGIAILAVAARIGGVAGNIERPTVAGFYVGYGGGLIGCVLIFIAVLGAPYVPRPLIYLGRISYGLYVFHNGVLLFAERIVAPSGLSRHSLANALLVDGLALILCTLMASLSYRYFESPFLRLKERFAVVKSRPV